MTSQTVWFCCIVHTISEVLTSSRQYYLYRKLYRTYIHVYVGQDSEVDRATCWTVRGSNTWWKRDFPDPSKQVPTPTQPPVQWVPVPFPGVERPGNGFDHPPSFSVAVGYGLSYTCDSPLCLLDM
jgi:hypothetical protein